MTNEELAAAIQSGRRELIPVLWGQVERLAMLKAADYFNARQELCASSGVAVEDLQQESYFAFLDALRYFDAAQGYAFTTFLRYPVRNAFNALCGMRTERGRREPLNTATSLDVPAGDGDDSPTLLDMLADGAADGEATAIGRIYQAQLHDALEAALATLPGQQERLLRGRYYEGLTYEQTARQEGITWYKGRAEIEKGLHRMRMGKARRLLEPFRQDIISRYAYKSNFSLWRYTGTSSTERAVLKLEQAERDGFGWTP